MIVSKVDLCTSTPVCSDNEIDYISKYIKHFDLDEDVLYVICSTDIAKQFVLHNQSCIRYPAFGKLALNRIVESQEYLKPQCYDKIKAIFKFYTIVLFIIIPYHIEYK